MWFDHRHYILRGPPDTPYAGGEYHGQLLFPPEFPFKPPGIKMQTPSGRFAPNTKICTSMSDYHPHTWQPGWNTSTILIGLLSFMCSDEMTTGSVTASSADRKKLAEQSHAFNLTQKKFCQIFPEYAGQQIRDLPNMGDNKQSSTSAGSGAASGDANKSEKVGSIRLRRHRYQSRVRESASLPPSPLATTRAGVWPAWSCKHVSNWLR